MVPCHSSPVSLSNSNLPNKSLTAPSGYRSRVSIRGQIAALNQKDRIGYCLQQGIKKESLARPVSAVMVALVPKDPRTNIERFRRDQSNLDGTFMVGGILPGRYTLIAVEDAWGFAWMKPGVLEKYLSRGQELTIGELMNGRVTLPDPVEAQER